MISGFGEAKTDKKGGSMVYGKLGTNNYGSSSFVGWSSLRCGLCNGDRRNKSRSGFLLIYYLKSLTEKYSVIS